MTSDAAELAVAPELAHTDALDRSNAVAPRPLRLSRYASSMRVIYL